MKYSSRGFFGTTIFHLILLLILIFFGFSYPDPPPEEMGVLVNFGTDETGLGKVEPAGDLVQGGAEEAAPAIKETKPEVKKEVVREKTPKKRAVEKNVQNFEESPVKVKTPTAEELKQKEIERQQQEELKRKQAEEEKKRQIAQQWTNKGQAAFGRKGVGTTAGSEGITSGTGNQGSLQGTPGAPNYGPGGGLGNGTNFGLDGRSINGKLPEPLVNNCVITSRVIVKVQITVGRDGNVIPTPKVIESNFQDNCIYGAVLEAASKAKFNVDQQAAVRQQGWIRYIIEP
jgi:outer membrane biosynthesis protein TonB